MVDYNRAVGDLLAGSSSRRAPWRIGFTVAVIAAAFALSACDKLSHVGQQTDPPPTASAATVGQPFTKDSSGNLQTTVRAGADVVLTGTNSEKGSANNGLPIIQFTWTQQSSDPVQVDLVQRDSDTVSFTAPQVTAETKLNFQLTVADADGSKASTNAVVTVEPVRDADHFLQYLTVSDKFTVTAVTSAAVPAATGAAVDSTLGFTVTVQEMVSFTDINGDAQTVSVGAPKTYTSGWSAQLGSGGASCVDARNPQLQIPIPKLNLDDKLSDGSARLSDLLEFSDIDRDPVVSTIPRAVVYAKITIQSTALPSGTSAGVCVNGTAVAAPVTMSSDSLLQTPSSPTTPSDNSASSHVYYATIDPEGAANPAAAKSTLTAWLTANHFDPSVSGWGADANAVYTNGFDLGLGRDMYMKVGTCDDGYAALPLQQRIGHCDVASVVVNYGGVQAAANRINPILAVAMEYSATSTSAGKRFVKFYVFAPDTRTGALQRVTSVDLDHRGQRSVPQSCVVCHGGVPGTVTTVAGKSTYSNGGDVGAGWLSWDLDSFYYSDTDPGFSQKSQDAALKAKYTRAKQEAQFKLLNSATYLTLDDPNRFALEKELIEGWYGGAGLPNATFNGTYVPPGWQPGGVNNNPVGSDKLYTEVFAHNCRMCHVLQAPATDTSGAYVDPRTVPQSSASSVSSCNTAATTSGAVTAHQVPMGCYWEFANARNLQLRLSNGDMPFARRTMDRTWAQPDGSQSTGVTLQNFLAMQTPAIKISTPGTSIARYANAPNPPATVFVQNDSPADPSSVAPVDIGNAVRLDATNSAFPDTVTWGVAACTGAFVNTTTSPGTCQRALPIVGSGNPVAWFVMDDTVTYQLSLKLDAGGGSATAAPYYFQVPEVDPKFVTPLPSVTLQVAAQTSLARSTIFSYGNGGAAKNTVLVTVGSPADISVTPACAPPAGCSGTTVDAANGFTVTSTGGAVSTSIGVTVVGAGSSANEAQSASIAVTVSPSIVAPAQFPLGPVTAAGGPYTFNILNAAGGAGAFPSCSSVQVSQVTYTGGRLSTSSFDASTQILTYTPATGFATYDTNGGNHTSVANPQESFGYTIDCQHTNNPAETVNGTFYIEVVPRFTFTQFQQTWTNNSAPCSGCHSGATPSAPPLGNILFTYSDFINDTTATTVLGVTTNTGISVPLVDVGTVASSGVVCWPNQSCAGQTIAHGGGLFCLPGQSPTGPPACMVDGSGNSYLTTIYDWIQDGANDF